MRRFKILIASAFFILCVHAQEGGMRIVFRNIEIDKELQRAIAEIAIVNQTDSSVFISRLDIEYVIWKSLSISNAYEDQGHESLVMMEPDSLLSIECGAEKILKIGIDGFLCERLDIDYFVEEQICLRNKDFDSVGCVSVKGKGVVHGAWHQCVEERVIAANSFCGLGVDELCKLLGPDSILITDENLIALPRCVVDEPERNRLWEIVATSEDRAYFIFLEYNQNERRHIVTEDFCVQNSNVRIQKDAGHRLGDFCEDGCSVLRCGDFGCLLTCLIVGIVGAICVFVGRLLIARRSFRC